MKKLRKELWVNGELALVVYDNKLQVENEENEVYDLSDYIFNVVASNIHYDNIYNSGEFEWQEEEYDEKDKTKERLEFCIENIDYFSDIIDEEGFSNERIKTNLKDIAQVLRMILLEKGE